ncbi:MAG: phosphoesterase PA-phosphatase related protein [Clostridia bacterium]|jgi:hypothetical protein|nr:phosphoesterase PA-phosphatase related protein [Clostridia bacterium]
MNFQIQILQYLESIRTEFFTAIMVSVTVMAESLFLMSILAILYWCVDKVKSIRLAFIVLFSSVINGIIKTAVQMPRPFEKGVVAPLRVKTATSSSFPSGHTQSAVSFWGGSSLILKSRFSLFIGLFMAGLTAFSRLYLGVHWPMDVVGGVLLGILSIFMANHILGEKALIKKNHILAISVVMLFGMVMPIEKDLAKAIASLWGMVCGLYVEQNYIHFEPIQKLKVQIVKVIIGMGLIGAIYIGLKNLFPEDKLFDMIRYAVLLWWITAGAPYLFKNIKWNERYV